MADAKITDQESPGRKQIERYSVAGGLAANKSDQATKATEFLLLKNCLIDKRLNAVLKRPGSLTETIASSLGLPLGAGEYVTSSNGQTIPVNSTVLINFAGSRFFQKQAGVYSEVLKTAFTDFATSRTCTFTKIGQNMFIAGGLPAKWGGPGKVIDRMGIIPPAGQPTITSYNTGSGITLVAGASYVTTYFDSATGLESDWSEPSAAVPAIDNKSIVIGIPAETTANYDKIRIYRYFDGGGVPYLVDTVPAGTTSYTDSKPDAQLTTRISDRYDKQVPPSQAYLCTKFAQCVWMVDGSDPYKLVVSQPYTGSDSDLEYFPRDNYLRSNDPITGLLVVPGKLLIFHPRSISYISGGSIDDFVFQPFVSGVGTVFSESISTNGTDIVFLAEQGFVAEPIQGGQPRHISREIDHDLQPLLSGSYNAALHVSTTWNPSIKQFLFMIAARSTANAPWEEVGTGSTASAVAGWQTPALVDDVWEDVGSTGSSDAMKIRIWGWSPELSQGIDNIWMENTFAIIPDDNVSGKFPIFLFHPSPSSDVGDPQQDKTLMGYWDGTEGKVCALFRKDRNTDEGSAFTAELITGRIIPGNQDGAFKLFHGIGFQNSYSDPTSDSNATLKYLIDFDDPQLRNYAASLITISDTTDMKKFTTMLGRHIHLYLTDTSQSQSKILLGEFFIHYRERMRKEGR